MLSSSYNTQSYNHLDSKIPITLDSRAKEPSYQTQGSVGADLSCLDDCVLLPSITTKVNTGVAIQLPIGTAGLVYLRSSLGLQGVILTNGVGVIDPDYRGSIQLLLMNTTDTTITYRAGHRLGQLLVTPVIRPDFVVVTELDYTNRGNGGFGSTGTA